MKKLYLLLGVFFLFGFSAGDPYIRLKAIRIEPLGPDKCSVALELHNDAYHKINFLSMYCSDSGFYVTDNPNVKVIPKPCGKNFPTSVPIARNSYRNTKVELAMAKGSKEAKFRIGFKYIEIPDNARLATFDSSSVGSVTIWSNEIAFKR
jgi:hypothetical protein